MLKEYRDQGSFQQGLTDEAYFKEAWKENWAGTAENGFEYYLKKDELTWLLKRFLPKGERIIEGGCGAGSHLSVFARCGYTVYGLDYEPNVVRRLKALEGNLPLCVGDVRNLPLMGRSMACYVSLGVVEHFEEGCGGILREAWRVLKPGGLIIVAVPYTNILFRVLRRRLTNGLRNPRFWQYRFAKADLTALLKDHDFEVKYVYLVNQVHGVFALLNRVLERWSWPLIPERRLPTRWARFLVWPFLRPFSHLVVAVGVKR